MRHKATGRRVPWKEQTGHCCSSGDFLRRNASGRKKAPPPGPPPSSMKLDVRCLRRWLLQSSEFATGLRCLSKVQCQYQSWSAESIQETVKAKNENHAQREWPGPPHKGPKE